MESVIDRLNDEIEKIVLDNLPDNRHWLSKLLDLNPYRLTFSSAQIFDIEVDYTNRIVAIPRRALDFFWSASHLFYTIHQAHLVDQTPNQIHFRVKQDRSYNDAMRLYKRHADRLNGGPYSVMDHVLGFPSDDKNIPTVDEIFLYSVEWYAYRYLCKNSPLLNIKLKEDLNQIYSTDSRSASHLMVKARQDRNESKAGMGIFIACVTSLSQKILLDNSWSDDQRDAFEHTLNILSLHFPNGSDQIYQFASHILHAHVGSRRPIPKQTPNWKQFYLDYIAQLNAPNRHLGTYT